MYNIYTTKTYSQVSYHRIWRKNRLMKHVVFCFLHISWTT